MTGVLDWELYFRRKTWFKHAQLEEGDYKGRGMSGCSCLVMNPGLKFLTGVGSGEFFVARVWSAIYGLG